MPTALMDFSQFTPGYDAYWTPIEKVELSDLPAVMFHAVTDTRSIVTMAAYGTSVFEVSSAAPVGQFYFLVDEARGSILSAFCVDDQTMRPIWIPAADVEAAASVLKDHCRSLRWRTVA